MQKQYQAPKLTLVGEADEVILGTTGGGPDLLGLTADDFEFEQD